MCNSNENGRKDTEGDRDERPAPNLFVDRLIAGTLMRASVRDLRETSGWVTLAKKVVDNFSDDKDFFNPRVALTFREFLLHALEIIAKQQRLLDKHKATIDAVRECRSSLIALHSQCDAAMTELEKMKAARKD